ncbi:MAG TPA: tetratricopeptide repeat protein [Bryobacteraceae bacterium]|nr:tetratricopeptide repeat protein [Bryobacteraceae bacterium]
MKSIILTGILLMTAGPAGLFAQAPTPKPKSNGERKAIIAIQNAAASQDPDAIIKAAENLLNNYADTDYKEYALTMEAQAYQMKKDDDNAQVYADRVLQINPKSYSMELLIADATTPNIKDHDLNRDQEISKVTKLYNDAIENVKVAVKPNPQISDADWENNQKFTMARAYNGLGMVAGLQKNNDEAIKDFKLALDNDPEQDAYATRLANAYLTAGKKTEAIAICDKLLAKPNLHPTIKQVVTSIRNAASH